MEEMKLHRKLLIIQNQCVSSVAHKAQLMIRTEILQSKKKELEDYEVRLRARGNAILERDKQLQAREADIAERESSVASKEAALAATQERYNQAAEALRGSWDKLKEEQDQFRERLQQASEESDGGGYGELINSSWGYRLTSSSPATPIEYATFSTVS